MASGKISSPVIRRLPKYYRYICDMQKNGVVTVSSGELAHALGTTASQVRQDFNCFGGFGQQGVGYNIDVLRTELEKILLGKKSLETILIGAGNLGRAMAQFLVTAENGHSLKAAFDISPSEIGRTITGVIVQDAANLSGFCKKHKPEVAVLCVPQNSALELAPLLVELGIKGIWNFCQIELPVDKSKVEVENVHIGDSLMCLNYLLHNN